MEVAVIPEKDRLEIRGDIGPATFRRILAGVDGLVRNKGCQDIVLDFREVESAFPGGMLPLCVTAMALRNNRIDVRVELPKRDSLRRLFANANWAHFLEPRSSELTRAVNGNKVPALKYADTTELTEHINKIVQAMLGAVGGMSREQFAAAEWALNEVADNVLMHAQSKCGGLVQLNFYQGVNRGIEFVVADAGLGIPQTLREARPDITDDVALELAIQEGVTRNTRTNQGNGLFGAFEICRKSKGSFSINSGRASLYLDPKGSVRFRREPIPFEGTSVDARIDLTDPMLLKEALKFRGEVHTPADFIEHVYEHDDLQKLQLHLKTEVRSFGSRIVAKGLYTKIENLLGMCPGRPIVLDFEGVPVISSSFADEVFGRLFVHLGPMRFSTGIQYKNVTATVAGLIDRAIRLRFQQSLHGDKNGGE